MDVTYSPEDGETQRWRFDPKRVRASKAEMIEKRYGESWEMWQGHLQQGNIKARRVLLWHLLTLDHPTLRWEDVPDFYAGELKVEHNVAELTEIRERILKSNLPEDEKEAIFAALDTEITEAMAREEITEPEGKAPSSSDGNATPS